MKKSIVWTLVVILVLGLVFSGCGKQVSTGKDGKVTITVAFPGADESWKDDDYYKYICDKLNMEIEFETLSSDSAAEKARIWISSGSMPDVVTTNDFMIDEYLEYVDQGMIRELPENWEKDYPNVGFAMEMTGILDTLEENGSVSALVRPQDHYRDYIDEFRVAYAEGKNLREMMSQNEYLYIDAYGFAYRKDWAEKLGIETDYIMDYDDFMDMLLKFKEADLGGVGKQNTVGLAVDYTEAPQAFIVPFNSSYKHFSKNENGEYECGLLSDSTIEGVKAYAEAFRTGILAPDFYTQKTGDLNSLFCSERAGAIFPRANHHFLRALCSEFEKANPGKKAEDCIGVCWLRSPDGKVHGWESGNLYGAYYFSPDLSDEKMAKILELADYISSEEGGPQIRLGVPDVDYKKEGDEYIVLREANADGNLETLDKKYPSYEFFRQFLNPFYDNSVDTGHQAMREQSALRKAKLEEPLALRSWDTARDFYTADDYVTFNAANEVNGMLAEAVVAEGDVEENWKKVVAGIEKDATSVAANMNQALLGK